MIGNLDWYPISLCSSQRLCSPSHEEEIKEAVQFFGSKKSPGPSVFLISFYKKFGCILKKDICQILQDFHENDIMNRNVINNTYIALITKKKNCTLSKDFRPISLTTSLYKIIAKVLVNRLKPTLPKTIFDNQLAFVKGRQITDTIFMANEAVDYWKVSKFKGFVIELDIEKAFNKISWIFIDYMLKVKNYPITWRNWIKACINNVQYSVLINGKPQGRISSNRGIRQGDPLSPFIFVLGMDYFSRLIKHLEYEKAIKGVYFNRNCSLTHILFADDILLFVEDNDTYITNL